MRLPGRHGSTMSLREAASVVFGLVAILPILLLAYLLARANLLKQAEAQIGLGLAVAISILGFVVFRRILGQVAQLAEALQSRRPGPSEPARSEAARDGASSEIVPGLGRVTEIGQVTGAFYQMLDDL